MSKFFVCKDMIKDGNIILKGEDVNHIKNVLRYNIGDNIEISDGQGYDYLCKISKINSDEIVAKILDFFGNESEPNVEITLYQALPKAEKMELIIQKCVELGIHSIVPMNTDRTIVKINGKEEKKIKRWSKISESASKQARRGKIPTIQNVTNFKESINQIKRYDMAIIPYEKENKNNLKNIIKTKNIKNIAIFIGPEGGFSDSEIDFAKNNGVIPITLGKRILRTETAGFITTAILLHELEI